MNMLRVRKRKFLIALGIFSFLGVWYSLFQISKANEQPWKIGNEEEHTEAHKLAKKLKNPFHFKDKPLKEDTKEIKYILDHTFYGMFTHIGRVWETVPIQLETSLKRFKNHKIFSDGGTIVGKTPIHDIVSKIDFKMLKQSPDLIAYKVRGQAIDRNWGIGPDAFEDVHIDPLMSLIRNDLLMELTASAPKDTKWYLFTDSTSYVSVDGLAALLKDKNPNDVFVYTWGFNMLWSRGAAEKILLGFTGELEVQIKSGNISSTAVTTSNWCDPLVLFHDLKPWEIQTLYDRDRSVIQSVTYSDFYRDFILPFMKEERPNWKINPSGNDHLVSHNDDIHPQEVRSHCRYMCEMDTSCLAWQWTEGRECKLEKANTIQRGRAMHYDLKEWQEGSPQISSGYMIDRIRAIRNEQTCDPLVINGETANDDEQTAEGWHYLMQDQARFENSDVLQAMSQYDLELDTKEEAAKAVA